MKGLERLSPAFDRPRRACRVDLALRLAVVPLLARGTLGGWAGGGCDGGAGGCVGHDERVVER